MWREGGVLNMCLGRRICEKDEVPNDEDPVTLVSEAWVYM